MPNSPELSCTLVSDGSSDRVLEHPIRWLLRDLCPDVAVQFDWADFRPLARPPRGLAERIRVALRLYPARMLFVHRDAEGDSRATRVAEIEKAARNASDDGRPLFVCVVPVRMTEAWLLADEAAIRLAAGNPNGAASLNLPRLQDIEGEVDPKGVLERLLVEATELPARRRRNFRPRQAFHRLAQLISDYGPLRNLPAFQAFEEDLSHKLVDGGWLAPPLL